MLICCDIDGVLADVRSYTYMLPNWDEYFTHTLEFPPIPGMITLIDGLIRIGHNVVFVTGRPESNRSHTVIWLRNHVLNLYHPEVRMRRYDDPRQSFEIKLEAIREIGPSLIFEDEPRAVEAMKAEGFTVLQVHGYRYSGEDNVPFCELR